MSNFNPEEPYNELPLLPPEISEYESLNVYKVLGDAKASLAELKGRAPIIPNQKMLINTLVLLEAKDSSSIENIFTTSDKLYKAFATTRATTDPATKEVLKYREALWSAFQELKKQNKFSIELIVNIYRKIKDTEDGLRNKNVRIGNDFTTVYRPPDHTRIEEKLNNWIDFANLQNSVDPLIKMAMLHYQFESIHPFSDGNGRTGRVLNVLFLAYMKLLDTPILYLSKFINDDKSEYYRLFREVQKNNDWKSWILYMLNAINVTSKQTLNKINKIYDLFLETRDRLEKEKSGLYKYELIELIFHQPFTTISHFVDSGLGDRNTASRNLNALDDLGILKKEKVGNESLYKNVKLYSLLSNW